MPNQPRPDNPNRSHRIEDKVYDPAYQLAQARGESMAAVIARGLVLYVATRGELPSRDLELLSHADNLAGIGMVDIADRIRELARPQTSTDHQQALAKAWEEGASVTPREDGDLPDNPYNVATNGEKP